MLNAAKIASCKFSCLIALLVVFYSDLYFLKEKLLTKPIERKTALMIKNTPEIIESSVEILYIAPKETKNEPQ